MQKNQRYTGHTTNATPSATRNPLFLFTGKDDETNEGVDLKFRIVRTEAKPNAPEAFAALTRRAGTMLMSSRIELFPAGYSSGRIRYFEVDGSTAEAETTDAERLTRELAEHYERLRKADQDALVRAAEVARRVAAEVEEASRQTKPTKPEVEKPAVPDKVVAPTKNVPDLDF